jgi:hypothetical protein
MTKGRPKGASTGRLLLTSSSKVSQDEKSLGMIVLMARCTASTNVVSPGAAWAVSGPRPAKKLATAVPAAGPYPGRALDRRRRTSHLGRGSVADE